MPTLATPAPSRPYRLLHHVLEVIDAALQTTQPELQILGPGSLPPPATPSTLTWCKAVRPSSLDRQQGRTLLCTLPCALAWGTPTTPPPALPAASAHPVHPGLSLGLGGSDEEEAQGRAQGKHQEGRPVWGAQLPETDLPRSFRAAASRRVTLGGKTTRFCSMPPTTSFRGLFLWPFSAWAHIFTCWARRFWACFSRSSVLIRLTTGISASNSRCSAMVGAAYQGGYPGHQVREHGVWAGPEGRGSSLDWYPWGHPLPKDQWPLPLARLGQEAPRCDQAQAALQGRSPMQKGQRRQGACGCLPGALAPQPLNGQGLTSFLGCPPGVPIFTWPDPVAICIQTQTCTWTS
ncbi:hypothetical protein MC885_013700 [Smutsia gigantea]|nr:hypothetical protein MC885_013700 [Smutsia gigantea]